MAHGDIESTKQTLIEQLKDPRLTRDEIERIELKLSILREQEA